MNDKIKQIKLKNLNKYKKIKINLDKRINELKNYLNENKDLNKNKLASLQLQLNTLKHHRISLQVKINKLKKLEGRK